VSIRLFIGLLLIGVCVTRQSNASPSPPPASSPAPPQPNHPASFRQRLQAAESVKVDTTILGLHLFDSLARAHELFDPLAEPGHPAMEAAKDRGEREEETKVLWQLARSDFKSVLVKTDERGAVTYLTGFLRPGQEVAFEKIGDTKKAPILSDRSVAWDVVRKGQVLTRVVARGQNRKASSISIFVVKRPTR
jgi:hypothetical protein